MYPLFFIGPIAIVVIGYVILRAQGPSARPTKPFSKGDGLSDTPPIQVDDNSDQDTQVPTHTHRNSQSEQTNTLAPTSCDDIATIDSSSFSSSSWDSGSSSCSVDSSPSVDTSSY